MALSITRLIEPIFTGRASKCDMTHCSKYDMAPYMTRLIELIFTGCASKCDVAPYSERWGAGVEYHFQEFNEPYAPS